MTRAAIALLCCFTLTACSGVTEVVVEVSSDLPVPTQLDAVALVVEAPGMPSQTRVVTLDEDTELPVRFTVLDDGADPVPFDLTIRGMRQRESIVEVRRVTRFLPNRTVFVLVALEASCQGVECGPDETCESGACVLVEQSPLDAGLSDSGPIDAGAPDAARGCRFDPGCGVGGVGGLCNDNSECGSGWCCTSDNCGGGMCTYECTGDGECPSDMLCKHNTCFFACDSGVECADGMSCEHGGTVCEWK